MTQQSSAGFARSSQEAMEATGLSLGAARKRRLPLLGVDVGFIYLLDSKTRGRFGPTLISISPRIGFRTPPIKGKLSLDLQITNASRRQNGERNKLFLVAIGPEYRRAYIPPKILRAIKEQQAAAQAAAQAGAPTGGKPTDGTTAPPDDPNAQRAAFGAPPFLPYYGASVDAIYANIKVPQDRVRGGAFGVGGSVFVGVTVKQRFFVETRLRATSQIKGFNFSGAGVTLGVRF